MEYRNNPERRYNPLRLVLADWFLAGRQLPWWLIGLSMYATAIDSSDLVADSGGTDTMGLSVMVANWVGVLGGWVLAGFFVFW